MNKISKEDWQYLLPFIICSIVLLFTDILKSIDKTKLAYWSGALIAEPYRIVTSHFIHGDAKHLLINTFGIVIARFCLKVLELKNNYFFLLFITVIIPIQTMIFWMIDIYIFKNPISLAIGFSGIIYGINSFILLASIYGKRKFLGLDIGLNESKQIYQIIATISLVSFFWSLLPGISFIGHLSGFIAGLILFLV